MNMADTLRDASDLATLVRILLFEDDVTREEAEHFIGDAVRLQTEVNRIVKKLERVLGLEEE